MGRYVQACVILSGAASNDRLRSERLFDKLFQVRVILISLVRRSIGNERGFFGAEVTCFFNRLELS